jgi:hypothetical protein
MSGYGIGGGGLLGVAIEVLAAPVQAATTPSEAGGTLAAGTYRYYVTAINASGETTISNEQTATIAGATGSVTVNWAAVTGATGYKVYRTAAGGAAGTQLLIATVGAVILYLDDGDTPAGAYPLYNTAYSPGTYNAPTKFVPFNSESLAQMEATVFRRPIRQSADVIGAVAGNENVDGDVDMEALEDCIIYFLHTARADCVKTGSNPNFVYTYEGNANAVTSRTISITIIRSGEVFAYTGCSVTSFNFGIQDGLLTFGCHIIGLEESTEATPSPVTWPTTVPFGAGSYDIQIPTGTTVNDTDTFEWTVEDNGEAQFRLKNTGRGADFVKMGERDITITMGRDFVNKTEYNTFKSVTANSITLEAAKGANNSVELITPVNVKESYDVALSGQGDLVRGDITYRAMEGSPSAYQIVVKTQEDIAG